MLFVEFLDHGFFPAVFIGPCRSHAQPGRDHDSAWRAPLLVSVYFWVPCTPAPSSMTLGPSLFSPGPHGLLVSPQLIFWFPVWFSIPPLGALLMSKISPFKAKKVSDLMLNFNRNYKSDINVRITSHGVGVGMRALKTKSGNEGSKNQIQECSRLCSHTVRVL